MSAPDLPGWTPGYYVTTTVNGRPVVFMEPIADPLARTSVTVGWQDVLRAWLRRRNISVTVAINPTDGRTAEAVLALNPDHIGYAGTPSRKAWEAELHGRLGGLAAQDPAALERAARAVAVLDDEDEWDDMPDWWQDHYRERARAALAAAWGTP